jgi:hypothetical protein
VNLIESAEKECLAVLSRDVACRQNTQRAFSVDAVDRFRVYRDLAREYRIGRDELFGKRQIVRSLAFIVCKNVTVAPLLAGSNEEAIERRENQV